MIGLPRFAPKSLTVFVLAAALSAPTYAQAPATAPETAAQAPTTAPVASGDVKSAVEDFWHYARIARYDLAANEGKKIVESGADPEAVLSDFEQIAALRQDNLDQRLYGWQDVEQMRDVTGQILKIIAEGYRARRSSPAFINEQINRLLMGGVGSRPYSLAITRLRESGELPLPFMLDIIRDPTKKNHTPVLRAAIRDMGRVTLNPLVAATEMKEWDSLNVVLDCLGDLGYDAAAPYVARVFELPDAPASTKAVAATALAKLGAARANANRAADLFFNLGERFYNGQSSITDDPRFPQANIWSWDAAAGHLTRVQVPHEIFNDIMTMRACEYTLKLGGSNGDNALSLWLAGNYRREADLPEGQTDATRPENYPPAHYWGVEAGARYLNSALARALKDQNSAVAFKTIRSLQEIVGQSNLFADASSQALIRAMQYPDRKVRFEAAFALAAALPQTKFEGQQFVVPLLAEAIAQTGQTSVVVIGANQDAVNQLVEELKKENFVVAGAVGAEAGVNLANSLSAVDVIVVSEDIGPGSVDSLFNLSSQSPRLAGAAKLVMTHSNASPWEQLKASSNLVNTTTATDAAGLKPAIEDAHKRASALPLDADAATEYATRAGQLLLRVGISRGQVYDLEPAKATLLAGLSDARPEIVKLAGQCLALLNDKDAQAGLLMTASDAKTADDVKISLYKSLATSGKFWGNKLDATQLQTLEGTVADATNLDVRSAAAEARGAMNLPADQAKSLIVKQSKT